MMFFKNCGIDAYFSRCLSLTLPKIYTVSKTSEILIAVRDYIRPYIPRSITKDARYFCPDVNVNVNHIIYNGIINKNRSIGLIDDAKDALKIYASSSMVITDRIHIAAPCLAMGIPVIIIKISDNDPRYDIFDGITRVYTFDELKSRSVDFSTDVVDITLLQKLMLDHFNFTLKSVLNPNAYKNEINELRQEIANYHS